ncbi:MAG: transcriptional regulator [Robiginitomaculum sp.]|nr:MAG: transcriptional regulator [Robiginitomaculum sp.]
MAVSSQFKAFVCDLLSDLGEVSARPMFGGVGLYCEEVMFALISNEVLYLKADDKLKADLAEAGSGPFMVDFGKGDEPKPMNGYWEMPQSAMDDMDEACQWGQKALDYAQHMQRLKKKS